MNKILLFLIAAGFLITACAPKNTTVRGRIVKAPPATRQLGPAVFLSDLLIKRLNLKEGYPVEISAGGTTIEVRAYWLPDSGEVIGLRKEYRDSLHLTAGKVAAIRLAILSPAAARLKPRPVGRWIENYAGKRGQWPGMAYGAPHGDCDLETGHIVQKVAQKYGIPATAAYGARLSYRGLWFDMNRPLMKLPKPGGGVFPERVWNEQSQAVYRQYQDSVWANSGLRYGKRFQLFCSFHGHDLTVKLADGKRIQRPVMEAMGVGFKKEELRRIKRFYARHKTEYFKQPPMLVFGNLPEDRVYRYRNIPLRFFYSGLGTRVYGSLRSDIARNALHIETPNSVRLKKEVQAHTARFLRDLFAFIKDSVFARRQPFKTVRVSVKCPPFYGKQKLIPAGKFIMGAPDSVGWSAEHPQHLVQVNAFYIDVHEVTNCQYADFLNRALKRSKIKIKGGVVRDAVNPKHIFCRTAKAAPLSQLRFDGKSFKSQSGKEYFPVIFVSYRGAEAYAQFNGLRLPTEAEWEKAAGWDARKGKKYLYAYRANNFSPEKSNFEDSGDPFERDTLAATTPVGYYRASNSNGLYDMSGNVFEWCSDNFEYNYYKHKPSGGWNNPQGAVKGTMRTIRGGAWNLEPWITRTTFRLGIHPNATLINVGFRCVKDK